MVLNETIDGQDYDVANVGRTVSGRIETEKPIESPLFRVVQQQTPPAQPTPVAADPQIQPAVTPAPSPAPVATSAAIAQPNEQKEQN